MRPALVLALAAAALGAGCAISGPSSGCEPLDTVVYGVVESVGEALLPDDPAIIADLFEHSVKPRSDEIRVRLDDGRALTVVEETARRIAAGQRVAIVRERRGARIESVLPM